MARVLLELPRAEYAALWGHLLPRRSKLEQAAFAYASRKTEEGDEIFRYVEWTRVLPGGFLSRSGFHFELTDEMKASVIKRAHDLGASLVEFHSHIGHGPARFSPSDLMGFQEFVPHVWWRLKGRPYLAIVISRSGFDGLAWVTGPNEPQRLSGIVVGQELLTPSGLSPLRSDVYDE